MSGRKLRHMHNTQDLYHYVKLKISLDYYVLYYKRQILTIVYVLLDMIYIIVVLITSCMKYCHSFNKGFHSKEKFM